MLERFRATLARWIAPKRAAGTRMYAAARASRLAGATGSNSSADQELVTSLTSLRSRSRQLTRDASYAKRAKVVVVNNVIGSGIGLQAQVKTTRGELNKPVNDAIEEAYKHWSCAENCHTGGVLHFHDFERALKGEIFEAGEVLVRKHYAPVGKSRIPLALELVEAERIADETSPSPLALGNMVRMGIEVDPFYRPVRYWLRERHQGEFRLGISRSDRYEPVPADQIWHLKITDRWPQTRGVPWLHSVIRRLQDMDGLSEAEIVAARGAANYMAAIETPNASSPLAGELKEDGSRELELEPGLVLRLAAGEKLNFVSPNRPNTSLDPFLRMMLREVAAGTGVSYESLSRDYSQSNYSSSRLALLDDRDLWRFFQMWFIRSFRLPLHCEWLQQAVLARSIPQIPLEAYAVDTARYEAVRFKPRGWSWIDPTKEVEAFAKAVRNGFTTVSDVIAKTGDGADLEDILEGRKQELEDMKEAGLEFDTDPNRAADGKAKDEPKPAAAPPTEENEEEEEPMRGADFIEGMTRVADAIREQKPPVVNVPAPVVHVRAPEVHVAAPNVKVDNHVPQAAPPEVHVASPTVNIENKVEPTPVTVQNNVEPTPVQVTSPDVHLSLKPEVRMDEVQLHITNKVEVPPVEETEQTLVYDENREVTKIRTRRVREGGR